jgi:hypothetical protein
MLFKNLTKKMWIEKSKSGSDGAATQFASFPAHGRQVKNVTAGLKRQAAIFC